MGKIRQYMELFKIKQSSLLVLSGVFGYLIAAGTDIHWQTFLLFLIASILSVCGTTGINMYFDKDIDAQMFRTMNRPLPAQRLDPIEAHVVSLVMTWIGVAIGFIINLWVGITILIGYIVDAYVYSALLKRRTPLNIVIGAIAGGMPILGGYIAYTGVPDIKGLILSTLIMLWAILHIWFIAIYYLEDYKKAKVPMLPVVIGPVKTAKVSILISILMTALIYFLWIIKKATLLPVIVSTTLELGIVLTAIRYIRTNNKKIARKIFKFLSPYQVLVLLSLYLEHFIQIEQFLVSIL